MNPTYSSPRSTNPSYHNHIQPPFYNPQHKDITPPTLSNPISKPTPPFLHGQMPSSKSYTNKPSFEQPKINNNNSAVLKSPNDPNANFQMYPPAYSKNLGEMTKSSFHDPPRIS